MILPLYHCEMVVFPKHTGCLTPELATLAPTAQVAVDPFQNPEPKKGL